MHIQTTFRAAPAPQTSSAPDLLTAMQAAAATFYPEGAVIYAQNHSDVVLVGTGSADIREAGTTITDLGGAGTTYTRQVCSPLTLDLSRATGGC